MPSVPHPYLPSTDDQREEMLRAIGVAVVTDLFADIPEAFRDPDIRLPEALSELELRQDLEALAAENKAPGQYASFLGAGAYRHFVPAVVRAMASRGELLTSYTPYQPEVSQGTLQATYDFQSLICLLTSMDVANAGMYDGATALAEAALMACRVTGRTAVVALDTVNPRYLEVVRTYCQPQGVSLDVVPAGAPSLDATAACLLVQYPDFLGTVEHLETYRRAAHDVDALLAVSVNPVALGMLTPPGELGADIVTGECQPLGSPLSFGGPYVGLFACRQRHLRQMPGRIVGRTVDGQGRPGFVLTLQTREQHIRRQRATSNICTSEALVATGAAVHLAALGPRGLRQVADLCYHKAHYAAACIAELDGYTVHPQREAEQTWFHEFVVQGPLPPAEVNRRLLERGIIGGLDVSATVAGGMLLCVTEMNSRGEIDALVGALREIPDAAEGAAQ